MKLSEDGKEQERKYSLYLLLISPLFSTGKELASASQDKTILIWDTSSWSCIRRLRGHAAAVYCLDSEGDILVSGSADKMILTWKFSTGESLTTIKGHKGTVYCLKLVGNILVSGSADRTIKVIPFPMLCYSFTC